MSSLFHDLFVESPYAAAVSTKNLQTRCSNCFEAAKNRCGKCSSVVYCGRECQSEDWPWHKAECKAFTRRRTEEEAVASKNKPEDNDEEFQRNEEFVRILGRILVRLKKDHGEVNLADGFPAFAKVRSFNDLMSHVEDFNQEYIDSLVLHFQRFFHGQPHLVGIDSRQLGCSFGRVLINNFCISDPPNPMGMHRDLGLGLYLNSSRFDHTCERNPRLSIDFNGRRIRIQFVIRPGEVDTGHSAAIDIDRILPKTEEEFNRLTLSYGFASLYWTAVPMIQQRRDYLETEYFFQCCCPRCEDQLDAVLSWDSTSLECPTCRTPYMLHGSSSPGSIVVLKDICKCDQDPERLRQWTKDEAAKEECKKLEEEFGMTMNQCVTAQSPMDAVAAGEPFRSIASKYWHPVENLRFTQLNEILFAAYRSLALAPFVGHWLFNNDVTPMTTFRFNILIPDQSPDSPDQQSSGDHLSGNSQSYLRSALKLGEILLKAYEKHLADYELPLLAHFLLLGELYELAAVLNPRCKIFAMLAEKYYGSAMEKWAQRGGENGSNINHLVYRLKRVQAIKGEDEGEDSMDDENDEEPGEVQVINLDGNVVGYYDHILDDFVDTHDHLEAIGDVVIVEDDPVVDQSANGIDDHVTTDQSTTQINDNDIPTASQINDHDNTTANQPANDTSEQNHVTNVQNGMTLPKANDGSAKAKKAKKGKNRMKKGVKTEEASKENSPAISEPKPMTIPKEKKEKMD